LHRLIDIPVITRQNGHCNCDDPIVEILGDFFIKSVIEAGKQLRKVMCPTLIALDFVVEAGSAALPGVGKAITVGLSRLRPILEQFIRLVEKLNDIGTGIKTAKMFKHAYEAQDAAMEWASMVSGTRAVSYSDNSAKIT
jgi:hypothetical protein